MNQKILLVLPWLLLATLLPALSFAATEPSAAPAPSVTGPLATNYFDLEVNFTKPVDAAGVLVVARQAYTPIEAPVDTTVYIANARLGVGDTIVAGCFLYCDYVVADAAASGSVTVTGLKDGTKYYFAAYSYNGSGTDINYNRTINAIFATTATVPVAGRSHNEMWVADSSPKDGVNWGTMTSADCAKCHGVHHTSQLLPSGQDQLNKCQSCHRAGGPASAKTDIGLHPADDSVDCGTCHSMHSFRKEELYSTNHAGGKGFNKSFVRANMSKYMNPTDYPPPGGGGSITGLDNTVFQNRPADFAFASADPVSGKFNGPCQSCHKDPDVKHHTQTGTDGHHTGEDCIVCHKHSDKFMHGGGSGTGCVECHGHDAGTFFDSDMTAPYTAGSIASPGRGTVQSHSTHTEIVGDDLKGPGIYCDSCHDINNFPNFKDDIATYDTDGDGRVSLDETQVCDGCHSEGGSYAGLTDPVVGAKEIWKSGAYVATDDSTLRSGKEQWCATCHDDAPSQINGVTAPNVIGDEDEAYTYGTGWGYYKTGHGLASGSSYPESGGLVAGAGVECSACHDFSAAHIDGLVRTFDDKESSTLDPSYYRTGYRLNMVAAGQGTGVTGREPLMVPYPDTRPGPEHSENHFRLCFNCHTNTAPFMVAGNSDTNFKTSTLFNLHEYHTLYVGFGYRAFADWSGNYNSRITCMTCHNVHGSTRLAMVRDGSLVGREPGLEIWYNNPALLTLNGTAGEVPAPADIPLTASTGWVWRPGSALNLCSVCHGGDTHLHTVDRTPYPQPVTQAPILAWAGGASFEADGVSPDSGPGGSTFTFRVKYVDTNNDAPTVKQLWIDRNDDGAYDDPGEQLVMDELDPTDTLYYNGKIYTLSLELAKGIDDTLKYCFNFQGGGDAAIGEPDCAHEHLVTVTNATPVLAWTGETNFAGDGVNPNVGGDGATFEFRIKYTDDDGECPPAASDIQVWIDKNDNGRYDDPGEENNMTAADANSCADGRVYTFSTPLTLAGDGNLTYTFRATDGIAQAAGESGPIGENQVTVLLSANSPPTLDWATADCLSDGVRPSTGAVNANYEFRVKYTDADSDCPSYIGVVVGGSPYELTAHNGAACSAGRTYYGWVQLATAGTFGYSFTATDGTDPATGAPVTGSTVTVVNTNFKVRPAGDAGWGDAGSCGVGWCDTVQAAVDASGNPSTILVYPRSDFTSSTYGGVNKFQMQGRTIKGVCGPDLTVVSGGGSNGFNFNQGSNNTLDGLTVANSATGIYMVTVSNIQINNCIVRDNSAAGVILTNNSSTATISDSDIRDNDGGDGGGVRVNSATLTMNRSKIRGNLASNVGGGLYVYNGSATLTNVTISGNKASANGGGAYAGNSVNLFLYNCTVSGNKALGAGGGISSAPNFASRTTLKNSILYNNHADGNGDDWYLNNFCSIQTMSYSYAYPVGAPYIQGFNCSNPVFSNNLTPMPGDVPFREKHDPSEADTALGDYRLAAGAPCIDAGTTGVGVPDHDIEGDPRPWPAGGGIDMGADEYVP